MYLKFILAILAIVISTRGVALSSIADRCAPFLYDYLHSPIKILLFVFEVVIWFWAILSFGLKWYWTMLISLPLSLIVPMVWELVEENLSITKMLLSQIPSYKILGRVFLGLILSIISVTL